MLVPLRVFSMQKVEFVNYILYKPSLFVKEYAVRAIIMQFTIIALFFQFVKPFFTNIFTFRFFFSFFWNF